MQALHLLALEPIAETTADRNSYGFRPERSTADAGLIHFRSARIAEADKDAFSVITMTRPRGDFGIGRDTMSLDGKSPPGLSPGVAGVASSKLKLNEPVVRAVVAVFNNQRVVARSWPLKENRVVFAEFHD